jgi:hypothetical protein
MLLSEQLRDPSQEQCLIDDMTGYSVSSGSWATVKNYGNITLAADSLVVFHFQALGYGVANTRLKIGSYYVAGGSFNVGPVERYGLCYLAAGTYAVVVEGIGSGGGAVTVSNFSLGRLVLPDFQAAYLQAYSGTITASSVATRQTLIGSLGNCVLAVQAFANTPSAATQFENVGDNLTNGVSISIDGAQVNWSERDQDVAFTTVYGAADAKCHYVVSVGSTHTVTITKRNANTVVHLSVAVSPWMCAGSIAQQYCPVSTFSFPQGTTLYVVVEPFSAFLTKGVVFGRKHAVTIDTADDYYASFTGIGVVVGSYGFETQDPGKQFFVAYGCSGYISAIAVDVR